MSALTWDQVLAEQQHRARVLSLDRMRAEMAWAQLTKRAPSIFGEFVDVPCTPIRPEPAAPRGRGKRQQKASRPVLVEKRHTKMLTCPDGRVIACKRRVQTYIAA
jgi:hypothetical protein